MDATRMNFCLVCGTELAASALQLCCDCLAARQGRVRTILASPDAFCRMALAASHTADPDHRRWPVTRAVNGMYWPCCSHAEAGR